eukprot:10021134-Heterocapsa_arctica.AAC.1
MARHPCSGLNFQGKIRGYGRSRLGHFLRTGDYARFTDECWKEGKQAETNILMMFISYGTQNRHMHKRL